MARRVVRGALWFGLLGPAIGSLLFLAGFAIIGAVHDGAIGFASTFLLWPLMLVAAYVAAGVPAAATGLVVAPFRERLQGWRAHGLVGVVAGLVSFACGWLRIPFDVPDAATLTAVTYGVFLAVPGGIAGLVVSVAYGRAGRAGAPAAPIANVAAAHEA